MYENPSPLKFLQEEFAESETAPGVVRGNHGEVLMSVTVKDWEAKPGILRVRVETPLPYMTATYYRRTGGFPEGHARYEPFGWYCNDTDGSRPEQDEFAPIMDALVRQHAVLSAIASEYGL